MYSFLKFHFLMSFLMFSNLFKVQVYFSILLAKKKKKKSAKS